MELAAACAFRLMKNSKPISVAHVIFRLHVGGLENGVVNLINRLPAHEFRHSIICIDDYTDFRNRIQRPDVAVYAINKRAGKDFGALLRIYRCLKNINPDVLHTRNLAALDALLPALLAGVRYRIHGEHGRDMNDLAGQNRKLQLLRKLHRPLVHRYIALSRELGHYLQDRVRVPAERISQIYNGVDTQRFTPAVHGERKHEEIEREVGTGKLVVGTVGRIDGVKDQANLVSAVSILLARRPELRPLLRLVVVGDGSRMADIRDLVDSKQVSDVTWLAGSRDDVSELMQSFDIFVLPSLDEGISNTILEAMATALPVVATRVGGNSELVVDGVTGKLVPRADSNQLAAAIETYALQSELRSAHGTAGRSRVESEFDIETMVQAYRAIYAKRM